MPKLRHAQRVLIVQVPALRLQQPRLLLQEGRGVARDFRILARCDRRDRGREGLGAGQGTGRLDVGFFFFVAQRTADQAFRHLVLPVAPEGSSGMLEPLAISLSCRPVTFPGEAGRWRDGPDAADGLAIRVSGGEVFLHEHTEGVVGVIAERPPALIAG